MKRNIAAVPSAASSQLSKTMGKIRANIGCGMTPTSGWENFDNSLSVRLSAYPYLPALLLKLKVLTRTQMEYIAFCQKNSIKWADGTKRIPLPDDSVEVLYSSHMLEHLDRDEARSFLKEALRVLQPGGIIRIAVPDLARAIERYNQHKDADEFLGSTLLSSPNPRSVLQRLRLATVGNRHHLWMYDEKSLARFLRENGFQNTRALMAGETTIAGAEPLDLYERADESIYVEANKI